jgi:hypothetical protein
LRTSLSDEVMDAEKLSNSDMGGRTAARVKELLPETVTEALKSDDAPATLRESWGIPP